MEVQSYLFFEGRCEEAIQFYRKVFGAEVKMMMRNKEAPGAHGGPANGEKIMHAELQIGKTTLNLSDGRCDGAPKFQGSALCVVVETGAEAERIFAGLSDGGKVTQPLGKTFFASHFGMASDRFGVLWMVYVGQ